MKGLFARTLVMIIRSMSYGWGCNGGYGVHDMHMNGALEHLATVLGGIEP
jgi:hypothetical protein